MLIEENQVTDITEELSSALNAALTTIRYASPKIGLRQPKIGRDDLTYEFCNGSDWIEGFWSGQLWLAYACSGDKTFLEAALAQKPYFLNRLDRPETFNHDLGFLYTLSLVADYRVTGNQESRQGALRAAEALAGRFNPRGGFIRAWEGEPSDLPEIIELKKGRMIIDGLENLGLLYWAARESGDNRFYEVALTHARTAANYLIRPDYSTFHTFDFNPATGEPLGGSTHQGLSQDSCWSRGQAWAIHGFALSYAYTGQDRFRDLAKNLAGYALARLPEDGVPFWDYSLDPSTRPYRDSSAGAITAAGLLLLAGQLTDPAEAAYYRGAGLRILRSLARHYSTAGFAQAEGLLRHGAYHVGAGMADNMLAFGDYFYLEALLRAVRKPDQLFFW